MDGSEIRAWREARGWTLRQMGEELGIHYATISKWETGKLAPPGPWLRLALLALDSELGVPEGTYGWHVCRTGS